MSVHKNHYNEHVETEIKNTILLTICSKENEIIKYESNKKCTESVC